MPIDSTGTPFVFAAWVTGMRDGMPLARIIDYLSPSMHGEEGDDGEEAGCYGMEQGVVVLSGTSGHVTEGTVLLSDRAGICSVNGHEAFHLDGGQWHVGVAPDEEGALQIMYGAVPPGSHAWPDVRWQEPQEPHEPHEPEDDLTMAVSRPRDVEMFLY